MPIDTLDEFIEAFDTPAGCWARGQSARDILPNGQRPHIALDLIETELEHWKCGLGGAALRLITDLADECGFAIDVIPKRIEGPMTDEQLAAWYTRHGFRVARMRRGLAWCARLASPIIERQTRGGTTDGASALQTAGHAQGPEGV